MMHTAAKSSIRLQASVPQRRTGAKTAVPSAPIAARRAAAPLSSFSNIADSSAVYNSSQALCASRASTSSSNDRSSTLTTVAGLFGPKKKTVIITGASSGLGKSTARALIEDGGWYVIMACRNVEKGKEIAEELDFPKSSYEVMELELNSFDSVRNFVSNFRKTRKTLDVLLCNAAVYLPNQPAPTYSEDGYEESAQVNHLSHFLLVNMMLPDLQKNRSKDKRCIIVGSITGNTNTVGGGAVAPFADLGDLKGLAKMGDYATPMMDGKGYNGAKAYKDSKLANMMTVLELHRRYHESTGITFSSMYPGCIAETALFRQKRGWFRWFFPIFMKYVTGGYVGEEEAGDRLAQVVKSEECTDSGVYWSWNGGARAVGRWAGKGKAPIGAGGSGGSLFKNQPSDAVRDEVMAKKLWKLSAEAVGLSEPKGKSTKGKKKVPAAV